jgi:hypothetical protein
MPHTPSTLRAAAAIQGGESVYILALTVLSGFDTASGQSYRLNSGIALTSIGACMVIALGVVTFGLARAHRWSRTPAMLTQLFLGVIGIYALQGGQFGWGIPPVVMAGAGFAALLAPASIRAFADGTPTRTGPGASAG